jgi:hypothetical protein
MGPDLSSLELPAIVEHIQTALANVRRPLTPGNDRVRAAAHVQVPASSLGNFKRVVFDRIAAARANQGGSDDQR